MLIDKLHNYSISEMYNIIINEINNYYKYILKVEINNNLDVFIKSLCKHIFTVKIINHEMIINLNVNGLFDMNNILFYSDKIIIQLNNNYVQINNNTYVNYDGLNKIKRIE